MHLSKDFIDLYRHRSPPWGSIGYITYKRTYSRKIEDRTEEWFETIERVCNALFRLDNFKMFEMERLYDFLFNLKGMVSGRALWQLGTLTVDKIGGDSLQSCWHVKVNDLESFCFTFNQLMLGGGVGFNIQSKYVYEMPIVCNNAKIKRVDTPDCDFIVPDNREGWVELLRRILQTFYQKDKSFYYSTQMIRPAGKSISAFGGTASGSESLVKGLDQIIKIIKSRYLAKLRPLDCLDIMNIIGQIVVAGNVRRSSEIALGDVHDIRFLRAKNWKKGNVPNWRSMSNNCIVCNDFEFLNTAFWEGYSGEGEPYGLINLRNCRNYGRLIDGINLQADPDVIGVNPCAEITLCHKEPCNLADIYLPNLSGIDEFNDVAILLFKACKAISKLSFSDPETTAIVRKNHRVGIGLTGYMECPWAQDAKVLDEVYRTLKAYDNYENPKNPSIKYTTIKPSGTLSLLAGVLPGLHAAIAPYINRRIRFSANDPLVQLCRDNGYHVEPQIQLDGSNNPDVMVVSFPIAMSKTAVLEKDLTVIQKLEIQKFVQTYWADNSISVTHYYRSEELNHIKKWLAENYDNSIKTVSFLLAVGHGFKQLPMENISEADYNIMISKIKPITSINDKEAWEHQDNLECSGSCPVK